MGCQKPALSSPMWYLSCVLCLLLAPVSLLLPVCFHECLSAQWEENLNLTPEVQGIQSHGSFLAKDLGTRPL